MKEGTFLDVILTFGNSVGGVLGLFVADEGGEPTIGGILTAICVLSELRLVLNFIDAYWSYRIFDIAFAVVFLFGLVEGGSWLACSTDGMFALGMIVVSLSFVALVRLAANYIKFDC